MFKRFAAKPIETALTDTPVVMLIGPRQCGKTTLVRQFARTDREYVTLDDHTTLESARADPSGFIRGFDRVIVDEIQRAPELLRAIKQAVDIDRRPGRFLLTGSANILTLPQVSESLAGRMEIVELMPLSRAEICGKKSDFLKLVFEGKLPRPKEVLTGPDLVRAVLVGGYPEMLQRTEARRRQAWARDYVKAIVERDVRDIADVEKLGHLPGLLQILAHHSGQLTNFTQLGGQAGLNDKTTQKYVGIFEQLFLLKRVTPWFENKMQRLVKTTKLHFVDSGLLGATMALTEAQIAKDRMKFGALLETFVFGEVTKLTGWADEKFNLHHYRDKDQDEVDIVIEDDQGALAGLEVKASATVRATDFNGMRKLMEYCGDNFKLGVVLYDGAQVVPFGERLFAAPISCLWN